MKNYFKKMRENRIARRIEKLRTQEGNPVVYKLHKSVLYEADAYEVIRYYVNLTSKNPLPNVPYDCKSNLLQLRSRNGDDSHYWVYKQDSLYYSVKIGFNSEISIGRKICSPFGDADGYFAYIELPLKSCNWQLGVSSELYGYFVTGSDGLRPIALMLRGVDVTNVYESIWGVRVEYEPDDYQLKGYDGRGLKGEWYDVWFSHYSFKPIYTREEAEQIPVYDVGKRWKGEKIIRQFKKNERPTLNDMLVIWDIFRKNV